ncbi:MAG TPA: CDP-glucose 4,6-dehydratase [Spirochaetia bacterium]|nr:CDP-glucose 4,6-dehydratase [Spirochaetia bacterium]
METMGLNESLGIVEESFWRGRRVFITGHTGFKGSWLSIWLHALDAEVTGYALQPPTSPNLYMVAQVHGLIKSIIADIRDKIALRRALLEAQPDIVIHLAAQPIVRESYQAPVATYETNVMGTVNLFEAVRECRSIRAVINVTTDKCYENREWAWGYRETDRLGGYDPYSNSKACSELITLSYRKSFFKDVGVATARAGNVIGGGDWAADRLVPDIIRAAASGKTVLIRNPKATRPWQHVLEPLAGYLLLAHNLYKDADRYSEAWNFGPEERDVKTVDYLVRILCEKLASAGSYLVDSGIQPHEAKLLKLDCSKAKSRLGWHPRWNFDKAIDKVVDFVRSCEVGDDMLTVCRSQIQDYMNSDWESEEAVGK